jgi:hypothetical protein
MENYREQVCWKKIGGGSLRWNGQVIKPNQTFYANKSELSSGVMRNLVLVEDKPAIQKKRTASHQDVIVYYVPGEKTSPKFASAFAKGCGGRMVEGDHYELGAWAAFGTPMTWAGLKQSQVMGLDWYYGDHGYFNRGRSFRVTRNAYQMAYIQSDGYKESMENKNRLERLGISLQPWQTEGENILVCPPDNGIAKLFGFSARSWKTKILKQIKKYTDRPIIMRERHAKESLSKALKKAWFLVTAFSNVAVDALIAGVPVHCTMPCGGTPLSVALEDIECPSCPDREDWLLNLCANQWTFKEIKSGMCWDRIGRDI